MELASAQVIGAGIAAIGVGAAAAGVGFVFGSFLQGALRNPAAAGVGTVFGSFLQGALRNPAAAPGQTTVLYIGFAAAELLGLMAFAVAMIILYAR